MSIDQFTDGASLASLFVRLDSGAFRAPDLGHLEWSSTQVGRHIGDITVAGD